MRHILAHHRGLLVGCQVMERKGDMVRVKVNDEKRPKWVDLSTGKHKLFDDSDSACDWIDEQNK